MNYLQNSELYKHWYPIIAVMVGTGLRVGAVTGLKGGDIDLELQVRYDGVIRFVDHKAALEMQ